MTAIFTSSKKLILASGSPRRQKFLTDIGLEFQVVCREIDETPLPDESPEKYVCRLARAKAKIVADEYPEAVVIGADTSVVCQDEILGKPVDERNHLEMLQKLSSCFHEVVTGFAVVTPEKDQVEFVTSQVQFQRFSTEILQAYVVSGDGTDKAGGYGMQSAGAFLVQSIEGSYSNVIGLPMTELIQVLLNCGAIVPRCTS